MQDAGLRRGAGDVSRGASDRGEERTHDHVAEFYLDEKIGEVEDVLPPRNTRTEQARKLIERAEAAKLHLVPVENLILFTAGAVCALKAANQENSHPQGDQNGQHARVRSEPVN
jgi:hypothetical protein